MEFGQIARRTAFVVSSLAVACSSIFLQPAPGARAQTPPPAPNASIRMSAEPMLGDSARPGTWAAVRVRVENDGPDVTGELRISVATQTASTFGIPIQLASGARQEHVLYGQTSALGSRFVVTLVSGGLAVASAAAPVTASKSGTLGVYVVAEHPEALLTSLRQAVSIPSNPEPVVVALGVADLPPHVEAWASIDRLIWQDVNSTGLHSDQLEALRTWVSSGGHLVILGGSTGTATLGAFPGDLLPFQPTRLIDVPTTDLERLLGLLPTEATALPAFAGSLERGTDLARIGDDVFVARTPFGRGTVALVGIDPSTPWLAGSSAAAALWTLALPSGSDRRDPAVAGTDDFISSALSSLPSAQLPQMDQVFLLIVAYIIVIGPINYLVLRRRDRREWAWLTMPAVILFFAVTAYAFGAALKGANVVVNELAIVRGAAGTDRGVAEVHIGIYSPSRSSFDVKVGGSPLLSAQLLENFGNGGVQPLDVLIGDPATVRGYNVGFGVLRGFRAEAAVSTPRIDADLRLVGSKLEGNITNASGEPLDHVSIVFGDEVQVIGEMAVGETHTVELDLSRPGPFGERLVDRLLGPLQPNDPQARTAIARRAIIQHLSGGWNDRGVGLLGQTFAGGPVILAFRSGSALAVDVGTPAEQVGETLFVLPARAAASGPVVVAGGLIRHLIVDVDAVDGREEGTALVLGRGTMTVEYRPVGFEGTFVPSGLSIRLATDEAQPPTFTGEDLAPLAPAEQPDPDNPLASDPRPDSGESEAVARIQLFDRVAGTWVEFEPVTIGRPYRIPDAGRYVDSSGSFRVRYVVRDREAYAYFSLAARLEGTVE
jgi:hypothetical protein